MTAEQEPKQESLGREIGRGLVEEGRSSLRFAGFGAVIGAVVLGGVGFKFFGLPGLAIGAAIGAIVGGVGAWLMYLSA